MRCQPYVGVTSCATLYVCGRTWLASPHVAQYLNMASNLLLGSFDAMFLEMVYHELVAPATAASRVSGPRRLPVLVQTWGGIASGDQLLALCSIRKRVSPSTKICSTSWDHTSLPSLRSLWCLRWGVRDLRFGGSLDSMLELEELREVRVRRAGVH